MSYGQPPNLAMSSGLPSKTHVRILTLKQMKEIINDIYLQKIKYDEKCNESRLPRETMEQYMYTYLNQRYGLKVSRIHYNLKEFNNRVGCSYY
jgi:hypothetical protein